jgi:putative addiction module component (TIGR02574 family)
MQEVTGMNLTMEQFGLDALSPEDRLLLAEQLWDSVSNQVTLTDAQRSELARRVAAADEDPNDGIAWDVIRAEARARWQK